jgi:hypothetical protein
MTERKERKKEYVPSVFLVLNLSYRNQQNCASLTQLLFKVVRIQLNVITVGIPEKGV